MYIYSINLMNSESTDHIKKISQPIVGQRDMFLVDVQIKHQKVPEVWVLVDVEEGGVDLKKCAEISRDLSLKLEDSDQLKGSYRLNVSSPGLSRPLSDKRQYPKNIGRTAKIKYKRDEHYLNADGVIEEVSDDDVVLLQEDGERVSIDFDAIVETKIIPKI